MIDLAFEVTNLCGSPTSLSLFTLTYSFGPYKNNNFRLTPPSNDPLKILDFVWIGSSAYNVLAEDLTNKAMVTFTGSTSVVSSILFFEF